MKRVKLMPNPVRRDNGTYYLWVAVPADIAGEARGTLITIPVGETTTTTKVNTHAKASLRTKDLKEARRRFPAALAAVEAHWDSLRQGPAELSHKQALALAGEVRGVFVDVLDDNPGDPERWSNVLKWNELAQRGLVNELQVEVDDPRKAQETLEARFGGFVDAVLRNHHLSVTAASRMKLLGHLSTAMSEAAEVNKAKALGDYSNSGKTDRYPSFEQPKGKLQQAETQTASTTFREVIDEEVRRRAAGLRGAPLRASSEKKYRRTTNEFASARGSHDVTTVTAREADTWMMSMLDAEKLSVKTIIDRMKNLKTVIEWARQHSHGEMFPDRNPLDSVTLPRKELADSSERTIRLDEATAILKAARSETKPDRRWLPWICAYSGARINEAAQLTAGDFFKLGDDWFYRITTRGGKQLKGKHSIRRVPVHPALVAEGLMEFVGGHGPSEPLFPKRAQGNVRDWVREELKLDRPEMAPNHGWRHLFEDMAVASGMQDSAKKYIIGRSKGTSDEGYGKSEALLPGLAELMRKIKPYL